MTYFHGTNSKVDFSEANPERGRYDICLTTSRKAAENYAEGGRVYEVSFDGYTGTTEDVVEIADKHGLNREEPNRITADSRYFYLLIDDPKVQEALVAEGIHAVEYTDEDWDNELHDCLRVLAPGHISLN